MSHMDVDEARVILGALFMGVKMHADFKGTRQELIEQSLADADALLLAASQPSAFSDLLGRVDPLQKIEARSKALREFVGKT